MRQGPSSEDTGRDQVAGELRAPLNTHLLVRRARELATCEGRVSVKRPHPFNHSPSQPLSILSQSIPSRVFSSAYITTPHHILKKAQRNQFRLVSTGLFAQIVRVVDTKITLKIYNEPAEVDIIKKRIYERLGSHPFILKYYRKGDSVANKNLVL